MKSLISKYDNKESTKRKILREWIKVYLEAWDKRYGKPSIMQYI